MFAMKKNLEKYLKLEFITVMLRSIYSFLLRKTLWRISGNVST